VVKSGVGISAASLVRGRAASSHRSPRFCDGAMIGAFTVKARSAMWSGRGVRAARACRFLPQIRVNNRLRQPFLYLKTVL